MIRITSPTHYQIFQRDAMDLGSIPIAGPYSGSPTAIEARFNGGSWAVIDSSPSAGVYSGTLGNQPAGQGVLEVRFANTRTEIWRKFYVGIGDVFLVIGQSNGEGRLFSPQFYTHATLRMGVHDHGTDNTGNGVWREAYDPTDTAGGLSGSYLNSVWPLVGTSIMAQTGLPVGFIAAARHQTGLFGDGGTWDTPSGSTYVQAKNAVIDANPGGLKGVLWYGNESDGRGEPGTQTALENALKDLRSQLSTDLGFGTLEMWVAQIATIDEVIYPAYTRATLDLVRIAQTNVVTSDTHMHVGPILYDIDTAVGGAADGVHVTVNADGAKEAARWWHMLKKDLYSGTEGRGPRFSSAVRVSSTELDITLTMSGSAVLEAGTPPHAGFRLTDSTGATVRTITAAARQSDTVIRLTSSSITVGDKISYASFNDGRGVNAIYDNTADAMPVEPFVAQSVT